MLDKPITAELGGVSPVLVVPGPYSEKELMYQAEDVASGLTCNAAFNCNTNRVVVLPKGWARRGEFLGYLKQAFEKAADRLAYYPGARERWERHMANHRGMNIGGKMDGTLPWTVVTGVDPAVKAEPLLTEESFVPIIVETAVGSADPAEFLERRRHLRQRPTLGIARGWARGAPKDDEGQDHSQGGRAGHRAASVWRRDGERVVRAAVRLLHAAAGAHIRPRLPPDIQSGAGWVHNTPMIEGIEKSVMRHPLTMMPKPAYSLSHRSAHRLMPRMTALEEEASWMKVPAVLAAAIRA